VATAAMASSSSVSANFEGVLAYHPDVEAAATNPALSDPFRYLPQRWAELVDEHTHFSRSATLLVDPVTAVRELGESALEFLRDPRFQWPTMLEAARVARQALRLEHRCGVWYRPRRDALLAALNRVEPVHGADYAAKRAFVETKVRAVVFGPGPLRPFSSDLQHPTTGYRARLLEAIAALAASPPQSESDWQTFDADLAYLAATVLNENRGGRPLALAVARAFAKAGSDADAAAHLSDVLSGTAEAHTAVVVIDGASSTRDVSQFGCTPVGLSPRWPSGHGGQAQRRLREFVRNHSGGGGACAIFVPVDAFDTEHARVLAVSAAGRILDQFAAEHRVARFTLNDRVLVIRHQDGLVSTERSSTAPPVRRARALSAPSLDGLERSLRYHRIAKREAASVLAVTHSWIALEHLAEGATKTYTDSSGVLVTAEAKAADFLPSHVAALAFLAAARNQVIGAWQLTRRACRSDPVLADAWVQVERWLQVPRNHWHVDPDLWLQLLREDPTGHAAPIDLLPSDPTTSAAASLAELAEAMPPFAQRRLREAMQATRNSASLVSSCSRAHDRASAGVSRIHLMRHATVHGALMESASAKHLARVAHDLLDATYEVLPHWLVAGQPVWESFRNARAWRSELTTRWNSPAPLTTSLSAIIGGP